jgi:hypothetical protein
MNPTQTSTPVIVKITNHLQIVEKLLLTALAVGIILTVMKIDSTVTRASLLGLAVTFFLYAYRPKDIPRQENEQFGFAQFIGLMTLPKVLWISSAISSLGIAFYLFDFGNDGYKQMLMIGGLTIGVGALLFLFFLLSGVKHITIVTPILLRALPLFLADVYFSFN